MDLIVASNDLYQQGMNSAISVHTADSMDSPIRIRLQLAGMYPADSNGPISYTASLVRAYTDYVSSLGYSRCTSRWMGQLPPTTRHLTLSGRGRSFSAMPTAGIPCPHEYVRALDANEIRLLTLNHQKGQLSIELSAVGLESAKGQYTTLSYCWGDASETFRTAGEMQVRDSAYSAMDNSYT